MKKILLVEGNLREVNQEFTDNGIKTHTESLRESIDYFTNNLAAADYAAGHRAMVYTTSNNDYINSPTTSPLEVNFGETGLPDDTTIFFETHNEEWIEIPLPFISATPNAPWPNNIQPWDSIGPVDESLWSGRFKIRFETPDLTITVPEGAYSPGTVSYTHLTLPTKA